MRRLLLLGLTLSACAGPSDDLDRDTANSTSVSSVDTVAVPAARPRLNGPLFAFEPRDEYMLIEPIAIMRDGQMTAPHYEQTDSIGRRFGDAHYAHGTRYPASVGGALVGVLEVDSTALAGCTGMPARARFVESPLVLPARGVAYTGNTGGGDFLDEPTDAEDALAREHALAALRRLSAPEAHFADIEWQDTRVLVDRGARSAVTAATMVIDSALYNRASVLVVVEQRPSGPVLALEMTHSGGDEVDIARYSLFDATDLDGDGGAELIVAATYYESWDYTVLRRAPGVWTELYRGGGGGC